MVAVKFKSPAERAKGFMLLARHGTVRTVRGPIYVFQESGLAVLDKQKVSYEKVPLPVSPDDVDAVRNTPTTVL